ncbi:MAG: replicative DNA helicase [Candidatus Gracilibacteria bacterium]|jgi:replicative DNA helicase|nr:replicative DNA helicase [Candidatus Gracilibacteria bacterium]
MSSELKNTPPQALDAEECVIGSVLIDPESLIKISDFLIAKDFYSTQNARIFDAILALSARHEPIDIITLSDELGKQKVLEEVGGNIRLSELMTIVPSSSHVLEYAKIVKKKSTLRKMILAGDKIKGFGYDEKEDIEGLLERSEKEVFAISQTFLKNKFVHIRDIISDRFDVFSELHASEDSGAIRGIPTGYKNLDNLLSGFNPSDLVILAARPSMGKTALALSLAMNVAMDKEKPRSVGIFSLEMSKEQLTDRMFASRLAVDSSKLQRGELDDADFQRMGRVMDELSSAPIFIDDSVGASIAELRAKARRLQMEHGLDFIVVDYLQLMTTGNAAFAANRVQEISEISRSLKALGRELHVPILALSQLSRAVEMRNPKIPQLADLRESGAIEQDADVVMMLYREDYYEADTDREGITDVFIRKHRNGPVGAVELRFDRSQMRFYDVDNTHSYYE